MPVINSFGGIVPRTPWHLLKENEATVAHNVKLRNGKIQAWRERLAVGTSVEDAVTLYYHGCCPLTYDTCVSVAEYVVDWGRLYVTGHADQPEVLLLNNCAETYYYLGVPAPTTAPTVSGTESTGRACASRNYVYTFVNMFGEESAPSPASVSLTMHDGDAVEITDLEAPPDGYAITQIWLYRTATGYRDQHMKEQEPSTDYLKVAEIDLPDTSYTDEVMERYLGIALTSRENRVPPADLRHIAYLRGTGVLTGVTTNQVHFSKAYQPYNWPAEYDLTLPYNIVNMVTVDDKVYVSTDSYPYVINGAPSCEPRQCRNVADADYPLPDISCGYAHSAIATPFGMVYCSKDGLVLVSPDARFQIITSGWFSSDDWVKVRPDTARLCYWRGYLICVTDMVSFMLEIGGDTYQDFQLGVLTTISDQPVDMVLTNSGELMMLDSDQIIYQWNAGPSYRDYVWESRELTFAGLASPTSAKIRTTGTLFRLMTPFPDVYYERSVVRERPFRLARLGRHVWYRIGLYGTGDVEYVDLGMTELSVNRGQ